MSKSRNKGKERLLDTVRDLAGAGIFYIYGEDGQAQEALLREAQEIAMKIDPAGFDLTEMNAAKVEPNKFVETLAYPAHGGRMLIIIRNADQMSGPQRRDFAAISPYFLEHMLIILAHTLPGRRGTVKDERLLELQDMVDVRLD